VTVEADGVARFGQDTEAAVYFCCLEALQNTAKYAHATQASICLQKQGETLRFTISDDGTGYNTSRTPMGSGLRNMADRLAALGGRLEVRSAPGQGTTITGQLPVPPTREQGPAHEGCRFRARTSQPRRALRSTQETSGQPLSCRSAATGGADPHPDKDEVAGSGR
jgi:Histidine kinase-, DNA gyrase B-, and HSP90-like ATPase